MKILQNAKGDKCILKTVFLLMLILGVVSGCGDDTGDTDEEQRADDEPQWPNQPPLPGRLELEGDLNLYGIIAYGRPAIMARTCLVEVEFCTRTLQNGAYRFVNLEQSRGWLQAEIDTADGMIELLGFYDIPANGERYHLNPSSSILARMAAQHLCPGQVPLDCFHEGMATTQDQLERGLSSLLGVLWPEGRSSRFGPYEANPVTDPLDYLQDLVSYQLEDDQLSIYWQDQDRANSLISSIPIANLLQLRPDNASLIGISPIDQDMLDNLQPPLMPATHFVDANLSRLRVHPIFTPAVNALQSPPLLTELMWLFEPPIAEVAQLRVELHLANGSSSRWLQAVDESQELWLVDPGQYLWWLEALDIEEQPLGQSWGTFNLGWDEQSPVPPTFGSQGSCLPSSTTSRQFSFLHCKESQDGLPSSNHLEQLCRPVSDWQITQGRCPRESGLNGQDLLGTCRLENSALLYYYPDPGRVYTQDRQVMAQANCLNVVQGIWQLP